MFGKTTPYGKNFQNSVPKVFTATLTDVMYANFVKFSQREIGEIVCCLSGKKNPKFCLAGLKDTR